ncbi:ATP-binding protein [Collinsella tanakaei]|uniref:ATP-binding protein n=1 Tax=Collinsella tanakaei TaxID=626935 RepID=UPI00195B5909|nr:ATP-binding protein [Collinsella tanakaei]MBM6868855.1 ATP-binding protein [Collinsella tanakaei]
MTNQPVIVPRPQATEWLLRWKDRDVIKVVTGLRRCGKSTALKLAQQALVESGVSEGSIVSIDLERMGFAAPTTPQELYDCAVARIGYPSCYVFIDEPQRIKGFERAVDALYAREDCDVYITGSNSDLLSSELATLLTGRYVEFRLLPLSFAEYRGARCAFAEGADDTELLNSYLSLGGMPYASLLPTEDVSEYLDGVLNTILVKDVATRHPRISMPVLRALLAFLADNVGNRFSLKTIADTLTANGSKVSPTTVGEYLDALMECYLIFKADPYDAKGRRLLQQGGKYYLGDLGFRHLLLGRDGSDLGHRVENVVYLELLRRYHTARVGRVGDLGIDFVAEREGKPHYYQVALSVLDEATLRRELRPLELLGDAYPKTLLTLDRIGATDHNGIEQRNLVDWLLE